MAVLLLTTPVAVLGQADDVSFADGDTVQILERIRELQADFERYREAHTPIRRGGPREGRCDEQIGRICIWFGGEDEEDFPAELREVTEARRELLRRLSDAYEAAPHRWTLGQLVHYLVEDDAMTAAERLATECDIDEAWWCSALLGYVYHVRTEYVDAEDAFREALRTMPDAVLGEWTSMRYVLSSDGREELDDLPPAERTARWELFWRLSDPLFLFEGNDRFTDHLARWVVVMNRREAAHPMGMEWDEDLEETLIRYGRNTGYSRDHDPERTLMRGDLRDTRRMIGHHHPESRGYLFPERFLESPSDTPPESWITAPREARTWHAPLYAPEIRGLETQVGRFRREDAMLVVGAYRPTVEMERGGEVEPVWGPEGSAGEPPHAALFLIPEDGGPFTNVLGRDPEGVLTIRAAPGRYVSSLEVVDLQERRAWRARQGVVQDPLSPGMVSVSDVMILREGAPLPDTFEEAVPHVRPGIRVSARERFGVFWEVYGLRIQESVRVTVGFSEGRPGFLERVGDFLGIIEPDEPIEITFDDVGPDRVQEVFRSVELELPDLDPGEYTLHLSLELAGRTPVVTSRPIVVEEE